MPKIVMRTGLVAKIEHFSPQNDDENGARRQKMIFFTQNWRRERSSSPKLSISHLKMTTRMGLVAKNEDFSSQNGDENGARRQN